MCGIGATLGDQATARAGEILMRLVHRGPDGSGKLELDGCTLVMTRLAIMDPTSRADQPMSLGEHHLVFNGELVNFTALRAELEQAGERFATAGDTEVVLHALALWGPDAVRRFRGMFAFLWWDGAARTLYVSRDRHGIKPLYWSALPGGGIAFASEAATLAALAERPPALDAVREFLRFGSPITDTAWEGVHEVEPGTVTAWRPDGRSSRRPFQACVPTLDFVDALTRAVEENFCADRPVDLLLSGGFDSALLAAIATRAGRTVTAHTLLTHGNAEDVARARRTATRYGVELRTVEAHTEDVGPVVERYLRAMDQPTIDGLNSHLVTHAVVRDGFPVAVSGVGGDELFGGYGYHRWRHRVDAVHPVWSRLPPAARRRLAAVAASRLRRSVEEIDTILRAPDVPSRHRAWRSLFSSQEVARLTGADATTSVRWATNPDAPDLEQLRTLDLETYLRPTLLRDTDVFSMANSVEVRVPLLDDRLTAALKEGTGPLSKRDVAKALGDRYLASLADARKLTFGLPWDRWLVGVLETHRPLLDGDDPWMGVVDPVEARRTLNGAADMRRNNTAQRVWALIVLARWLARPPSSRRLEGVRA